MRLFSAGAASCGSESPPQISPASHDSANGFRLDAANLNSTTVGLRIDAPLFSVAHIAWNRPSNGRQELPSAPENRHALPNCRARDLPRPAK
jgi:hypothetical protein